VIVADLIDSAILNFNHFSADGLDHKARERRSLRVRAVRKTLSSLVRRKSVVERLERLEYLAASKGPNAVGLRPRPTNKRVEGLSRLTEWVKSHFPRLVMRPHALPIVDYQVNDSPCLGSPCRHSFSNISEKSPCGLVQMVLERSPRLSGDHGALGPGRPRQPPRPGINGAPSTSTGFCGRSRALPSRAFAHTQHGQGLQDTYRFLSLG
jgi:hypothetical protein